MRTVVRVRDRVSAVKRQGRPYVFRKGCGDAQGDGRVDPADLAACQSCVGAPFAAACAVFDFDGDCAVSSVDRAATEFRLLDLNRDGSVNSPDIAYLLAGWLRPDLDLTGDAVVNAADLARLLAGWWERVAAIAGATPRLRSRDPWRRWSS